MKTMPQLDVAELEQLVAQIGEEMLARAARLRRAGAEGSNIPEIVAADADRVSAGGRLTRVDPAMASLIDHTLLRPDARRDEIVNLCAEARAYGFASVCVNPFWAPLAAAELAGSPVKVCTVVGFPLGAGTTAIKRAETEAALRVGAQEIDMVLNIGALKSGDLETVKLDIEAVTDVSHRAGAIVKVIIEAALLEDSEKAIACTLAKMAGADFVKTSTGFGPSGASARDVAFMRSIVGPDVGVKASGGIRSLDDLKTMTAAGASRIGASASVKIIEATAV